MTTPHSQNVSAYDVVIVGGGMVGGLCACALSGSALKVAVLERQSPNLSIAPDYDTRVSALTLASRAMLENVAAWSGITHRRYADVQAMRVWQAQGGGAITFDAADIGERCLAYIVENSVIVAALHERLAQATNVHVVSGATLTELTIDELAHVTLSDNRRLSARLVVGADGIDSEVRRRLGVDATARSMEQQAIVATVRTQQPHRNIARQVFLSSGPLAFLPLPEPQLCSIVWSLDNERARELQILDDTKFGTALRQALGEELGDLTLASQRQVFPIALSQAQRYVGDRFALIGDAAHSVHPLAGQGVNLGFLDAAALAETLLDAVRERRDIGMAHVLRRYERWRKGDNLAMIAATGGFRYLFGTEAAWMTQLLSAGLSATDAMTPLKNMIMRRASGLVGDLPKLARHQAV